MTTVIRVKALRWAWILLPCALVAQPPQPAAPAKPDSTEVLAHIEKAKKLAGTEWPLEEGFFCEAKRVQGLDPKSIQEPTKIFDNVYAMGQDGGSPAGSTQYVITTPEGYIMIDAGFTEGVEPRLLTQFKQLGLDPAKVKIVLVTHGHPDHFGGSLYFQEHFNSKIYVSEADWDFIYNIYPVQNAKKKRPDPPAPPAKKDMVAVDGQAITLGGEKVIPVLIPGHTPGSMGFIFDVMDKGKRHVAAIWGGTILGVGAIPTEGLQTYVKSLAHFEEMTKKAKVDVELQNHPFYDNFQDKLAKVRERKPGEPNPLIVGQSNYVKFVEVMSECTQAQIGRRAEQ